MRPGRNNAQIARQLAVGPDAARRWRRRWLETAPPDPAAPPPVGARSEDLPRPGRSPGHFTGSEQFCQLLAMGRETPAGSERPISHWTPREIAAEAQKRGIVTRISPRHVARLYKKGDLKPHLNRYWLTPAADANRQPCGKRRSSISVRCIRKHRRGPRRANGSSVATR